MESNKLPLSVCALFAAELILAGLFSGLITNFLLSSLFLLSAMGLRQMNPNDFKLMITLELIPFSVLWALSGLELFYCHRKKFLKKEDFWASWAVILNRVFWCIIAGICLYILLDPSQTLPTSDSVPFWFYFGFSLFVLASNLPMLIFYLFCQFNSNFRQKLAEIFAKIDQELSLKQ